ncbi:MAG TPA: enolase C-terminal domain-like protein [Acidimicrobiia bacterium]|nr:enolase C-terminal domain-like protein [Acidimicrobiia bacterium]
MRIESMAIHPITMRLVTPIPMSNGVVSSTGNVLVELRSDDGVIGWGEGVEAPALTGHRQADIVSDLEALRDLVIGADPEDIEVLWARLAERAPGASTARGAIDIAVYDLIGRHRGLPVHALLGGMQRSRIPALTLVGSGDRGADAEKLSAWAERGYSWFKIKLAMADREVEWATLAHALEAAGPDGMVCGDANEGWDETTADGFLAGLDGMKIRFVEQPVPRDHPDVLLRVAERSPVAICADESAGSLEAIAGFGGTAIGGVSLKLIKHGGITGVMRGARACADSGLEVNLAGKVIESTISAAANLHCAAAMPGVEYGCSPANQGVVGDVSDHPVTVDEGFFTVPEGPGLGVEVDRDLVRRLAS